MVHSEFEQIVKSKLSGNALARISCKQLALAIDQLAASGYSPEWLESHADRASLRDVGLNPGLAAALAVDRAAVDVTASTAFAEGMHANQLYFERVMTVVNTMLPWYMRVLKPFRLQNSNACKGQSILDSTACSQELVGLCMLFDSDVCADI
jgi:hypothetical protein